MIAIKQDSGATLIDSTAKYEKPSMQRTQNALLCIPRKWKIRALLALCILSIILMITIPLTLKVIIPKLLESQFNNLNLSTLHSANPMIHSLDVSISPIGTILATLNATLAPPNFSVLPQFAIRADSGQISIAGVVLAAVEIRGEIVGGRGGVVVGCDVEIAMGKAGLQNLVDLLGDVEFEGVEVWIVAEKVRLWVWGVEVYFGLDRRIWVSREEVVGLLPYFPDSNLIQNLESLNITTMSVQTNLEIILALPPQIITFTLPPLSFMIAYYNPTNNFSGVAITLQTVSLTTTSFTIKSTIEIRNITSSTSNVTLSNITCNIMPWLPQVAVTFRVPPLTTFADVPLSNWIDKLYVKVLESVVRMRMQSLSTAVFLVEGVEIVVHGKHSVIASGYMGAQDGWIVGEVEVTDVVELDGEGWVSGVGFTNVARKEIESLNISNTPSSVLIKATITPFPLPLTIDIPFASILLSPNTHLLFFDIQLITTTTQSIICANLRLTSLVQMWLDQPLSFSITGFQLGVTKFTGLLVTLTPGLIASLVVDTLKVTTAETGVTAQVILGITRHESAWWIPQHIVVHTLTFEYDVRVRGVAVNLLVVAAPLVIKSWQTQVNVVVDVLVRFLTEDIGGGNVDLSGLFQAISRSGFDFQVEKMELEVPNGVSAVLSLAVQKNSDIELWIVPRTVYLHIDYMQAWFSIFGENVGSVTVSVPKTIWNTSQSGSFTFYTSMTFLDTNSSKDLISKFFQSLNTQKDLKLGFTDLEIGSSISTLGRVKNLSFEVPVLVFSRLGNFKNIWVSDLRNASWVIETSNHDLGLGVSIKFTNFYLPTLSIKVPLLEIGNFSIGTLNSFAISIREIEITNFGLNFVIQNISTNIVDLNSQNSLNLVNLQGIQFGTFNKTCKSFERVQFGWLSRSESYLPKNNGSVIKNLDISQRDDGNLDIYLSLKVYDPAEKPNVTLKIQHIGFDFFLDTEKIIQISINLFILTNGTATLNTTLDFSTESNSKKKVASAFQSIWSTYQSPTITITKWANSTPLSTIYPPSNFKIQLPVLTFPPLYHANFSQKYRTIISHFFQTFDTNMSATATGLISTTSFQMKDNVNIRLLSFTLTLKTLSIISIGKLATSMLNTNNGGRHFFTVNLTLNDTSPAGTFYTAITKAILLKTAYAELLITDLHIGGLTLLENVVVPWVIANTSGWIQIEGVTMMSIAPMLQFQVNILSAVPANVWLPHVTADVIISGMSTQVWIDQGVISEGVGEVGVHVEGVGVSELADIAFMVVSRHGVSVTVRNVTVEGVVFLTKALKGLEIELDSSNMIGLS
ncbi:hypothetical protein HK096_001825 [Nowakowskiella sp. JEL0078]|nr:hypothetical protein HK096_001825 [Nowakowskiella sp. JEL0078]